jgi:transglutaminase-like putative cysteine protease
MTKLSIRHITTYHYRYPVALSPHRLILRPREGRDLLLASHEIQTSPSATLTSGTDVFGNVIATATFAEPSDRLEITSLAEVDLRSAAWPVFDIAASAIVYPFQYDAHELKDLGGVPPVSPDRSARLI